MHPHRRLPNYWVGRERIRGINDRVICSDRERMRFEPQRSSHFGRINPSRSPPYSFVTAAVDFAMVSSTERNRELIAHLAPERLKLCKPEMVSVCGLTSANHARLLCDEPDMVLVPNAARL
jgi:hypothetical protein